MSATQIVTKEGPKTFTPAATETILGGQLIEGKAASRGGVAGAGSVKVLGVCLTDCQGPELFSSTPTTVNGRPVLNAAVLPTRGQFAYGGMEVNVTYAAAANYGDKLIAAANGQVTPAGATPDARTIVGTCTAPAGVGSGAVGLMRTI